MASDWKLSLTCNSGDASNAFVAADANNLWQSRAQGNSGWNNAGNSTPQAKPNDNVYVSVNDGGNSASSLISVVIGGRARGHGNQAQVTPFTSPGNPNRKSAALITTAQSNNGSWLFGPFSVQQTGRFELTFAANLANPTGNEQSTSWEMDPEFDVVDVGK
jgi:hypothetical protein